MTADSRMLEVLAKYWDESHAKDDWPSPPNPIRGYNQAYQDPNIPLGIALWALRIIAKEAREAGIEESAKVAEEHSSPLFGHDDKTAVEFFHNGEKYAQVQIAQDIRSLIHKDQT